MYWPLCSLSYTPFPLNGEISKNPKQSPTKKRHESFPVIFIRTTSGHSRPWKYPKTVHPPDDDFTPQAVWMALKRCPGRWRSDKKLWNERFTFHFFCIKWNGNQNFMRVNSLFLFTSVPTAVHPRRSRITKSVFKGVLWCIPKSQLQNLWIFTFLSIQQFSINQICKAFSKVALSRFGSGWAWLGVADGVLKVTSTANQERFGVCNSGPCGRLVGTGWEVLIWSYLVQRWVEINESIGNKCVLWS